MSIVEIDSEELGRLRQKAEIFDQINLNKSLNIAQDITNNAINVNSASKTRLSEVENIEQLVNIFINHSNEIQTMSDDSLNSAKLTSQETTSVITLVQELFDLIDNMSNAIDEFSHTIEELNNKNNSITELVKVNDKISMQTNLLAINAAIEASKAKEFGRGFAIVATEVKKLAASSKESTLNIGNEIDNIKQMTSLVTNKNEAVQALVKNSVEISKDAILKLKNLILMSNQNSENSNTISRNVNQQLENSDTIKDKIHNVVEDTRKAIDGSQTNIELGQTLIQSLKN